MDAPVNANEKTEVNGADGVSEPVPGAEDVAAARLAGLVSPEAVDRMLADAELAGVPVDGAGGLIGQLTAGDPAIRPPARCRRARETPAAGTRTAAREDVCTNGIVLRRGVEQVERFCCRGHAQPGVRLSRVTGPGGVGAAWVAPLPGSGACWLGRLPRRDRRADMRPAAGGGTA